MPYQALTVDTFGGIDLREDQEDVGTQATDLLNVVFIPNGVVRQRAGYQRFLGSAGTNKYDSLSPFYTTAGTIQLIAGAGNRLEAISSSGGAVANTTAPTASPHFFARYGGPTVEGLFISNGTDTVRLWSAGAFSTPGYTGTTPTGKFVVVTPWDNRLVVGRFGGTTAGNSPSTVRFSDAGVPTTFGANNYIELTPGDGEPIMGMAVWGSQLFVFKQRKFFVFYGTTTDATGSPVFNYRTIDTGVGLVGSMGLVATPSALMFVDRRGVYSTTGGAPAAASDPVGPLFVGRVQSGVNARPVLTSGLSSAALGFHGSRLYVSVTTSGSSNDRVLTLDTLTGQWSIWDVAAGAFCTLATASTEYLLFTYPAGTKQIGFYTDDSGLLYDDTLAGVGTAVSSVWRSGWLDGGLPDDAKTVRETKVWGEGATTVTVAKDWASGPSDRLVFTSATVFWWDGSNSSVLWGDGSDPTNLWGGASSTVVPKLSRRGVRGTLLGLQFSNTTGGVGWAVHKASMHLRGQRGVTVVSEDN